MRPETGAAATEERPSVGQWICLAVVALSVGTGVLAHATPRARDDAERAARGIADVDRAISNGDVDEARAAFHDAYLATLQASDWEGAMELGHAQMRLAIAAGFPELGIPGARAHYREALHRAQRARSAEGVARVTAALNAVDGGTAFADAAGSAMPREAMARP